MMHYITPFYMNQKRMIMKTITRLIVILLLVTLGCKPVDSVKHDTESRATALQDWKEMKFGMFIHWGVYSGPAGMWEGKQIEKLGEQIQRHARISHDDYLEVARQFNPVNFDPEKIVLLAKNTGMKYIVITSKHHDGFCLWDSEHTDFDIVDFTPYKKDIIGQLAEACRKHGIKLGLYYSTPDWHFNGPNPEINPADGKISVFSKVSKANEDYQDAHLKELLSNYGDIVELFFDMGEPTAAQSARWAQTVHSLQPGCVINGRIMNNQGDFLTMPDNHVPDLPIEDLAWETPGTFYHTWGYKSWVKGDTLPVQVKKQIHKLSLIAARGGNFLLNIGPRSDGTVVPYEVEVLTEMGHWVKKNEEAIFGTETTPFEKSPWGESTVKPGKLYIHVSNWPDNGRLEIPGLVSGIRRAYPLAYPDQAIEVVNLEEGKSLALQEQWKDPYLTILVIEYDDKLVIHNPVLKADESGEIRIGESDWIKHGKYGKVSYRSILKDAYRTVNIEVPEPGKYRLNLSYKMNHDQKRFILSAGNQAISFDLSNSKDAMSGIMEFEEAGKYELLLEQGETFEFKPTLEEFNKQDRKYMSLGITMESLTFEPVH
jgi:alpha-L-fucosidase